MELSPKVRGLVDAARAAGGSTPEDRERVFAAVAARVGIATVAGVAASAGGKAAAAASTTVGAATATTVVISAKAVLAIAFVVTGSAAIGAGAVALSRRADAGARTTPVAMHAASAPRVVASPVMTLPLPPPVAAPTSASAEPQIAPTIVTAMPSAHAVQHHARNAPATLPAMRIAATQPAAEQPLGSLDDEMSLLRGAQGAIRAHDGSTALHLLDRYTARFPNGLLHEEALATEVFASCEIGRRDDAERAAQALLDAYPQSVHAARVRASCAGGLP